MGLVALSNSLDAMNWELITPPKTLATPPLPHKLVK